ncbi:DUF6507 family protein [Arthrobacter koreensis]|uniref:DUF6507 family protein n=1 Tax=Arthrobacter koreensis TaxID=199136 RepID=UPI0036DF4C32
MKFDMHQTSGPPPSAGGEGNFDVTPSVIGSVLSDVARQSETNETMARVLETAAANIASAAQAWPVAEQLSGLNTYVLQRSILLIEARVRNNITAVSDVVNILLSADHEMSDAARSSSAQAAQAAIMDDPLADPNAPTRAGPGLWIQ